MSTFDVRVHAIRLEAGGVYSFELQSLDRSALPAFTAGGHIDVFLPNGLVRSYSLANAQNETHRYVIGVHKDPASRGGSSHMHEDIRVGQKLRIGTPRNNFVLNEQAEHTVLIAGGIGITPLRSMADRLSALGKPWTLYYCGRERNSMAYAQEFANAGSHVHLHVDAESGGALLDLAKVVASAAPNAHFYCCGPKPMLAAYEAATAHLPSERVHVEYFSAKESASVEGGFRVELARSKRSVVVEPGKSILDAVLDIGVQVEFSCMDGICGSCEARVLAGIPDHRDSVLSKSEREANDRMLICCSGSRTDCITLDL
ncbi:PDR/VanB family oxidoreductase [Hydrogenophaga sp. BPS33]|uniref:PDR/VanB family oxidoreductase n=1 Tax=Hydrogenophaga sp. BPS33 TaxID=2651974 RepID=UPI00131F6382|nr:PDR/VanB family oxidoreductase [Hydrogenophaga sp. BPS33]QHE85505.1 oxidoreductase [Hydrogenophaga sp. BPS33]